MKKKKSADYFDTKRKLARLKQLSQQNAEWQIQKQLFQDIQTGSQNVGITLENQFIYRARWCKQGELFKHLDELIYPRPEYAKRNRFNDTAKSVFYGALCELGTIIELRPDINKFFVISRFKLSSATPPLFFPLGIKANDGISDQFSPTRISQTQVMINDFLNAEITKRCISESDYNLTILAGQHYLESSIQNHAGFYPRAGIVYSSVESQFISNRVTRNLAMSPELFHHHYIFDETFLYVLINEPENLILMPINKAVADTNGKLSWAYNFQETKERVSKGICFEGYPSQKIIGLEECL